jgi:hypothetical protein
MIKDLLKASFIGFALSQIIVLALVSSLLSNYQPLPTVEQLDTPENVSDSLPISLQKTAKKSRESSIALVNLNLITGEVSFASGTYIEYNGSFFILTAAHAVQKGGSVVMAVTPNDQYPCGGIVYHSRQSDIAIIEAPDIPERRAINITKSIPSYNKWKKSLESLDSVVYTGYPNATGPMTVHGRIMGFMEGILYVNMYAWSGASGSGVFDESGNIIGIVSALEVGDFGPMQVPLHSSIIVRPTYLVDWAEVFKDY